MLNEIPLFFIMQFKWCQTRSLFRAYRMTLKLLLIISSLSFLTTQEDGIKSLLVKDFYELMNVKYLTFCNQSK